MRLSEEELFRGVDAWRARVRGCLEPLPLSVPWWRRLAEWVARGGA